MSQIPPVCHLVADVVRQAADAEIGEFVGDDHRGDNVRVQLLCPQGRTDARIASTNNHEILHLILLYRLPNLLRVPGPIAGPQESSDHTVSWSAPAEPHFNFL